MRSAVIGIAVVFAGCAAVAPDSEVGFAAVSKTVKERTGRDVVRNDEPTATEPTIRGFFRDGLTVDEVVEIALVNNHDLAAIYTDLDVSQSDLVQASLLHNPVADAAAGIPVGGGIVDLSFGVALDVIDLLYVPLRKRVASAMFEQTKLLVAGQVLELVWRSRTTFHAHQADHQMLEMRRQVAASTGAAFELARRMREAGNVTDLELASEHALAEEAKLELRLAEVAVRESREHLNALMGLWGPDAEAWQVASTRLSDPPAAPPEPERLESRAVERSLDLAAAERLVAAAGENLGLDRASAMFPELVVGGEAERDGSEWMRGPSLTLPLPFFDRGQARIARARAELRRARELYHALAVRVRAVARSTRDRLAAHRDRALHYRNVLLPLRERVLRETELQYNAMQIGAIDLLRAKELEVETAERYVAALREYWLAQSDLALILAGRLPPSEAAPAAPALEQIPRLPFPTLH